jgi:hypothetical protein
MDLPSSNCHRALSISFSVPYLYPLGYELFIKDKRCFLFFFVFEIETRILDSNVSSPFKNTDPLTFLKPGINIGRETLNRTS